jgi:hypothetical protein
LRYGWPLNRAVTVSKPDLEPDAKMTEAATQLSVAIVIVVAVVAVGWKLFGPILLNPR